MDGPADTNLAELVGVAVIRWAIEDYSQTAKNEIGPVITRSVNVKRGTGIPCCLWLQWPSLGHSIHRKKVSMASPSSD